MCSATDEKQSIMQPKSFGVTEHGMPREPIETHSFQLKQTNKKAKRKVPGKCNLRVVQHLFSISILFQMPSCNEGTISSFWLPPPFPFLLSFLPLSFSTCRVRETDLMSIGMSNWWWPNSLWLSWKSQLVSSMKTGSPQSQVRLLALSLSSFLEGFYNLVSPRHSKNPVFGANLREPGLKASPWDGPACRETKLSPDVLTHCAVFVLYRP